MIGRNKKSYGEAREKLRKIASLKKILGSTTVTLDKSVSDGGFMYLSRFGKEESDAPKVKERLQKVASTDGEEVGPTQQKSFEPATSSNNNNDKKKKYALSLATLASKPLKRLTIVNEGAIAVLIELSSIYDKAIQVRVASALASLSLEESIRRRMIEEGTLAAIISLATNSNIREVKTDCARAICNLCCEAGFEFKMVKEGVPFVVTHIASTCPDTYDICLKILMNITCIADKFARIEDITEALMFFINTNASLTYEHELLMLMAFRNLAALKNNQQRLVEDGCLKIVDRFYRSSHNKLRKIACEILKSLTSDAKTRTKLLEQNILTIILQMYHDKDSDIRMLCIKSLLYLSEDENFRRKIVEGPLLRHIMTFEPIKAQNKEMGQFRAKALRKLCEDRGIAHSLVDNGVCNALILLLQLEDTMIQQYCAESLCRLFQTSEVLDQLIEEGAAEQVVGLARQTSNSRTREWCSYALYQLARSNSCSVGDTHDTILPCIIHLCEAADSTEISKRFCSAAFANATRSKSIDCSGAIPLLVYMLRNEGSRVIRKYCASALFNLADSNENGHKMLDAQVLLPVVELTQNDHTSGDSDPKVICAGIISRLSLHKQYYDQFTTGNVLKVLLELSCVDHRLTQRRVVIALSNLSQNEEIKAKLLALKPIPYIISLASERDEYLRRGCISIVCNMSYLPGSEQAIVEAGIMPTLLITSLITSDQIASKIICVKALVNLMADRRLYKGMVKDGIIWGLSKLAQLDDPEMLRLCAKALSCLSADFAREMLNSSVAVRTLLRLIDMPDTELMTSGARILTNILLKTNQNDTLFHIHVVKNMLPIAKSKVKELNELCVICLCLTSQSDKCRPMIVKSGMLQLIDSSTIFSDPTVCYAYITMFGNIANEQKMRTLVLDDHLIERFRRICQSKNYHLDLAVAKALYCLSCSQENIPKLVEQMGIVDFIRNMTDTDRTTTSQQQSSSSSGVAGMAGGSNLVGSGYFTSISNSSNTSSSAATASSSSSTSMIGGNNEVLSHLIACLFNLTTLEQVQHKLVSQGFVQVIQRVWLEAQKNAELCILAYLSICHLACGKTNTTQMVNDGCTKILCFMLEFRKNPAYRNYRFLVDEFYRCSGALRNLLAVVANQRIMVDQGCLDTIIELATLSVKERPSPDSGVGKDVNTNSTATTLTSANNNNSTTSNSSSSSNHHHHNNSTTNITATGTTDKTDPASKYRGIWRNCSAALNSLTYNQDVREKLVHSEAINIILSNSEKEGTELPTIGQGLMRELEAESWDNGARGRHKEGRARSIRTKEVYTEFLRGSSNVKLDVKLNDEILEKFYVQVQLDEPEATAEQIVAAQAMQAANSAMINTAIANARLHGTDSFTFDAAGLDSTRPSTSNSSAEEGNSRLGTPPYLAAAARVQGMITTTDTGMTAGYIDPMQYPNNGEVVEGGGGSALTQWLIEDNDLNIDKLTPFQDPDEGLVVPIVLCEKQSCTMGTETIALFRIDDVNIDDNYSMASDDITTEALPIPNNNIPAMNSATASAAFQLNLTNKKNDNGNNANDYPVRPGTLISFSDEKAILFDALGSSSGGGGSLASSLGGGSSLLSKNRLSGKESSGNSSTGPIARAAAVAGNHLKRSSSPQVVVVDSNNTSSRSTTPASPASRQQQQLQRDANTPINLKKPFLPMLFMQRTQDSVEHIHQVEAALSGQGMAKASTSGRFPTIRVNSAMRQKKEEFRQSIRKMQRRTPSTKNFEEIVEMLKEAKLSNSSTDEALEKWRSMSTF